MRKIVTNDEAKEVFESKNPEWKLVKYSGVLKPCTVEHKCGKKKEYKTYDYVKRNKPFCDECDKVTNWKYEIGEVIDNLQIIDRKTVTKMKKDKSRKNGERIEINKYYQYKCLKCGFDGSKECYKNGEYLKEHWVNEESLVIGVRCSCCHGTVVQTGINDVATTDPDVVQYFVDKELSKKYSRSAREKIEVQCPICGFKNLNKTTIYNLVWEGTACVKCGKSFSYPEKFIFSLLMQLNIKFEMHKIFEWSKNIKNTYNDKCSNKEYDFYLPDYNLIIESHGSQHYDNGTPFSAYGKGGRTLEEEQANDMLKQDIAIKNGYNYIVIDCKQSNFQYISNSIISSNFSKYITIENVDWKKCNKDALSGIKMLVINEKKDNPDLSTATLSKKYNVSPVTISLWLKQGADICGYDPDEERKKCWMYAKGFQPVYSKELNMAFKLIKEAAIYTGTHGSSISACTLGKAKHAGRNPLTGELLTWERWTLEQYESWIQSHPQNS